MSITCWFILFSFDGIRYWAENRSSVDTNLRVSSCIRWSRNGKNIARFQYWLGVSAGTLTRWRCLPAPLGIVGTSSTVSATFTAFSNSSSHASWLFRFLFNCSITTRLSDTASMRSTVLLWSISERGTKGWRIDCAATKVMIKSNFLIEQA